MATATVERPRTIKSATAIPQDAPEVGEDGYPVKMWNVNGAPTAFSLRPFEPSERKVYWCPKGPDAKMAWRAQELNEHGFQVVIQREVWLAGKFSPRNAWEEHMTIEWLRRNVEGGANGANWVGYDHPKNAPGETKHHWVCGTCGFAIGNYAAFDQHQLSKKHSGMKKSD
jgi:hypothetical protein